MYDECRTMDGLRENEQRQGRNTGVSPLPLRLAQGPVEMTRVFGWELACLSWLGRISMIA